MCDTFNPVGNVYCKACNARLVPMSSPPEPEPKEEDPEGQTTPIKGISLPTIPLEDPTEEREKDIAEGKDRGNVTSGDWLDELRASADDQPDPTETKHREDVGRPLAAEDIPDWLRELGPVSAESQHRTSPKAHSTETPSPAEKTTPGEQTMDGGPTRARSDASDQPSPSRLGDSSPSEAGMTPAFSEYVSLEPAEIPDWIRDLRPPAEATPCASSDELITSDEEFGRETEEQQIGHEDPARQEPPEWLRDILASDVETTAPSPPDLREAEKATGAEADSALIEIPDWLKEGRGGGPPSPPGRAEIPEGTPGGERTPEREAGSEPVNSTEVSPESVSIPDWLRQAEAGTEEAPPQGAQTGGTEAPSEKAETPDWLIEFLAMAPGADDDETSPVPAEPSALGNEWATDLERADIPDWLQELRPTEDRGEETDLGPTESTGPLKGLRGLIPAASAIRAPTVFELVTTVEPDEASLARAELLQSLLGQQTIPPRRESTKQTSRVAHLVEQWMVAAVLILSVVGMLLAPLVIGDGPHLTQPLVATGARDLYHIVDELDQEDLVLVAFDYGPPEADELNAAAQPVLEHILDRGAEVAIVSTRADGPLIAQAMMTDIADSVAQYTVIGYRPGTAAAVSRFLTAGDRDPTLLLILTGQPVALRIWIEQASARYGDQLPLIAVGSAALEPLASPYLDKSAEQLRGAIHGLKGGASYETLRGTAGDATQRLDVLAAGHIAIIILMITGALVHVLSGAKGDTT